MVPDPYGSGIYHFRHTASMESCRRCSRFDLAHLLVRNYTRRSFCLFRLPRQDSEAFVASVLSLICTFADGKNSHLPRPVHGIQPQAIGTTITLRRRILSPRILRVEFQKAAVSGLLIAYEESLYSQNATGKRFAS